MPFDDRQLTKLGAKLDDSRIHTRRKQGIDLRYIEGHDCIDTANDIFGYHGWTYQITKLELTAGVWVATVLLQVRAGDDLVEREDVGVGIPPIPRDSDEASPDAHEMAVKGAVTDALKRALRTFGDQFGNALYDKGDTGQGESRPQGGERQRSEQQQDRGDERSCPTCGQPMTLRSGTSQSTGNPWTGWFCTARCGAKPIFVADGGGR